MITALLSRATDPSSVADATVGSPGPTVVDLPADFDGARVYLPAPAPFVEARYVFPCGPFSPRPDATLADIVREIAS